MNKHEFNFFFSDLAHNVSCGRWCTLNEVYVMVSNVSVDFGSTALLVIMHLLIAPNIPLHRPINIFQYRMLPKITLSLQMQTMHIWALIHQYTGVNGE